MATSYQEAVERTIIASEQLNQIVNGTATAEIVVEDGSKIPSIRKALVDNFYFKDPLPWQQGQTEMVFNQLRKFNDGSLWYAPTATNSNFVTMGVTPVGDPLWVVYSLDAIPKLTPQIREALRRSYAEAGYTLVAGSFESGAVLNSSSDIVLKEATGVAYSYKGVFPHVVAPNSVPDLNFESRSHDTLREEIDDIFFVKTNPATPNFVRKSLLINAPRDSQQKLALMSLYGYTSIFPQGVALDETTGEIFISYHAVGGASSLQTTWVDVYKSDLTYSGKTFGLTASFVEGMIVGYTQSGVRRVAHYKYNNTDGLQVTEIPSTSSINNLTVYQPVLSSSVVTMGAISSYKEYSAVMSSESQDASGYQYGMINLYETSDLLNLANPSIKSSVMLPIGVFGGGDSNMLCRKPQGIAITPGGIVVSSGYQYLRSSTLKSGMNPALHLFDWNGNVLSEHVFSAAALDEYLSQMQIGSNADVIEPEGCAYTSRFGLITSMVAGSRVLICAEGVSVPDCKIFDYSNAYAPTPAVGSQLTNVNLVKGVNQVTGIELTTPDSAADFAVLARISSLSFQLRADSTFSVLGKTFTEGRVSVENLDGNFFFVRVESNSGSYEYKASGASPRNWTMSPNVIGGPQVSSPSPLGSLIQRGVGGFGQDMVLVAGTNNHTATKFVNSSGQIGSITMSASQTAYNTTCDERLKDLHGLIGRSSLDVITEIIESGAIQMAAFKSDPDNVFPMPIAQRLAKIAPEAVTPGRGDPLDEDFIPWQVDNSKLIPILFMALYELMKTPH